MAEESLEATICGTALASLLTGLPRLASTLRASPGQGRDKGALDLLTNEPSAGSRTHFHGGAQGDSSFCGSSLDGDSEGLLLGRISASTRSAMDDLTGDEAAASGAAVGSSRSWAHHDGGDESVVRQLSIERHWEATEAGPQRAPERLFDAAGASQSEALQQMLNAAYEEGAQSMGRKMPKLAYEESRHPHSTGAQGTGTGENVVGWFVRRRGAPLPLRPSMRESAATLALHRWLVQKAEALQQEQNSGYERESRSGTWRNRPILLLLLSPSWQGTPPHAPSKVHTSSYRLFVFDPQGKTSPGELLGRAPQGNSSVSKWDSQAYPHPRLSKPVLRPLRLQVLNLGSVPRPQYSLFSPVPAVSLAFADDHRAGHSSARLPSSALGLLAEQAKKQVELLEEAYQEQLQQLRHLAQQTAALQAQASKS